MAAQPTQVHWRTSTYSGAGKECVEVADVESRSLVRDSKRPELGHLAFASGEWSTFVSSLKGTANPS
ncbi:DUF397 domain-containing protein [Nocardiopsis sp. FIRDI 009]|uniref:DUF397 domain-containing protein n=1 Tax=Nocardiopsis sp. FIRDI 009 TaxID=714197 RepID=UPI000E225672|nr:DUF397 domain-containing protein [Nocardiopsis sp. FIRDI 009]